MNKREDARREMIGGAIGFLVVSCIYGGYLYIYKDVSLTEIIREIVVFTVAVIGITFIGWLIFFFLVLVWTKIQKKR